MLLDALTGEKMMEALEGIDDTIKRHNVRFVRNPVLHSLVESTAN